MNKNIAFDTLNAIDLFSIDDLTKSPIILHIPHSSTHIPLYDGYVSNELIENEIARITDWKVIELFNVENITKIITPFSRIFCDVERKDDISESMYNVGRGFYYTKTIDNKELRIIDDEYKEFIFDQYYIPHHKQLTQLVQNKLDIYNKAIIIDCHTFSNDIVNMPNIPDICIGINSFHTNNELLNNLIYNLKILNKTIGINYPYDDTIVPTEFLFKNNNVQSIMIEINRSNINDIFIDKFNGAFKNFVSEFTVK